MVFEVKNQTGQQEYGYWKAKLQGTITNLKKNRNCR